MYADVGLGEEDTCRDLGVEVTLSHLIDFNQHVQQNQSKDKLPFTVDAANLPPHTAIGVWTVFQGGGDWGEMSDDVFTMTMAGKSASFPCPYDYGSVGLNAAHTGSSVTATMTAENLDSGTEWQLHVSVDVYLPDLAVASKTAIPIDEWGEIVVKATGHNGQPAANVPLRVHDFDPAKVELPTTQLLTDADGLATLEVYGLSEGDGWANLKFTIGDLPERPVTTLAASMALGRFHAVEYTQPGKPGTASNKRLLIAAGAQQSFSSLKVFDLQDPHRLLSGSFHYRVTNAVTGGLMAAGTFSASASETSKGIYIIEIGVDAAVLPGDYNIQVILDQNSTRSRTIYITV